ncbi:MAG: hypothetical protein BECKG1743D_GA0114223_105423 [Candidatus Kentron sp. G]|nr:MAG: hypothetical protein BECKG1743F_GA0114225_103404 [Candidatus Kentron sp. G]VFN03523.1 MAG: hypothetical protein BECKG1743E_GA0114224_106263 [Candidatus Kentron sp. G]VFN04060.1 MAG: hypothetical protein BECKG1743D_GA0114223_105423 [Candidatus Kentron sp. G]
MSPRNILLDECVDRKLANYITGHNVQTVVKAGWASFKNGNLLRLAQTDFDVLVTADRNFIYQQNIARFDIAIIVLSARFNRIKYLLPLVPDLLEAIPTAKPGTALVLKAL